MNYQTNTTKNKTRFISEIDLFFHAGENCEEVVNHCILHPCLNSGSCETKLGGYKCACVTGYTGINCEIDIDECEEAPCINNATCNDEIGSYR